jgi:hypothetical protein
LLAIGFFLGGMLRAEQRIWLWTGSLALKVGHPILIAAAIGCGIVGSLGVVLGRALRPRVAEEPV